MTSQPPARRHPRSVYIRRRIAVLLGLAVTVIAVVMLVAGPQRVVGWFTPSSPPAASGPEPKTPPVDTEDATPTPSTTPDEITECFPASIAVEPVTDRVEYGVDDLPLFSIRVTNHSGVDCIIDLGTQTMAFTVMSGQERYWDSRDCQIEANEFLVQMEAGQTLETEPLEWRRVRSHPDTCDDDLPPVPAQGASYHLAVEIGGVASAQTKQFILY